MGSLIATVSAVGNRLKGFCLDYCFLHCAARRLADKIHYIKSVWIRPEDLGVYEALGYHSFKIVERSCPGDLLIRRVAAYSTRSFDGNLWELVAPVAQIKKAQHVSWYQRFRMLSTMAKPWLIKMAPLLQMQRFAESVVPHDFGRDTAPVYIDNKSLEGFLDGLRTRPCNRGECDACGYCRRWAEKTVSIDAAHRQNSLDLASRLDSGLVSGSHWI